MSRNYESKHSYPDEPAESGTLGEGFVGKSKSTLRFSRYLLLCVLVLVLAITLMTNRDSINMDNFRRMWTKLSTDESSHLSGQIAFSDDGMAASFKDGVALLTPSQLQILDNSGTVFMTEGTGFSSPVLLTDNRYAIAYDRGGTKLMVTNSFSVLFDKTMPEAISYVTLSDEHYLAVITTGGNYKNSLYVYNDDFEEAFVWHSNDRYLLNAIVSPDKNTVALICYNTKDGGNTPELVGIHLDEEQIAWSTPLEELPLDICYKSASTIALLHTDHLDFYNSKGAAGKSYAFEKNFLQAYHMDRDTTVLILSGSKRGQSTLYCINNRGKATITYEIQDTVHNIDVLSGRVAMLGEHDVQVFSLSSKKVICQRPGDGSIQRLCFAGKNYLLDIYGSYCVYNEID